MDFYMPRNSVEEVLNQIAEGHMVLVVDDTDRENEGDLVMAAEKVTPESINFMTTYGRGLVCVPMTGERLDYLRLQPMVLENTSRLTTAFTVSVDAFAGTTTGISAQDRATTPRWRKHTPVCPRSTRLPHVYRRPSQSGRLVRRRPPPRAISRHQCTTGELVRTSPRNRRPFRSRLGSDPSDSGDRSRPTKNRSASSQFGS